MYRSTDLGVHWKSIGGPVTPADTRRIAAINDNIIIATDTGGSVWRTDNSGGDPVILTPLPLNVSTADQSTDSVAGLVRVPIIVANPSHYTLLQCTLQFPDTSRLLYLGTYTLSGKNTDVPDEHWATRSKALFSAEDLSGASDTIGYSVFRVTPRSELPCADVVFDSIAYIDANNECSFLTAPNMTAHLCSCTGCPTASVAPDAMRTDEPQIFIFPNPAEQHVTVTVESPSDEVVTITIRDLLGRIVYEESRRVTAGETQISLLLPYLPSGTYEVQLSGSGFAAKPVKMLIDG